MKSSCVERRNIVDKADKKLSVKRQCELLSVVRSVYYHWLKEKPEEKLNLELMRLIDEKYLQRPHMGVRSMTAWLRYDNGYRVNHKRISRLYRVMGLSAIAPGPYTSKGCKSHKKYPYLLRGLRITASNQAWGIDITYIPIKTGYMYLVAIIDLYSRYVVGWSLSNTMEKEWVVECVKEAILRHGAPEIINSDQGGQFTSELYTDLLKENSIVSARVNAYFFFGFSVILARAGVLATCLQGDPV